MKVLRIPPVLFSAFVGFSFLGIETQATAADALPPGIAATATNIPGVFAYAAPPAGFNPLSASDAQLARYGIPPRPDQKAAPKEYARWKKLVSAPQKRITNPQLTVTDIEHRPAYVLSQGQPLIDNSIPATTANWSGYVVTAAAGTFASNNARVYSGFYVPYVQPVPGQCSGNGNYSSLWVGFDGYGSSDVLQAGVEADTNCSGGTSYSAWYEWAPTPETRINNLSVSPGDYVDVDVWYSSTSPYGNADIYNETTGSAVSLGFNPPSGTTYVGNSVEWVVEAPTVGGSIATMANYNKTTFGAYVNAYTQNPYTNYRPNTGTSGTTTYQVTMVEPPVNGSSVTSTPFLYSDTSNDITLWFDWSF